jgi:hypothetical protein
MKEENVSEVNHSLAEKSKELGEIERDEDVVGMLT